MKIDNLPRTLMELLVFWNSKGKNVFVNVSAENFEIKLDFFLVIFAIFINFLKNSWSKNFFKVGTIFGISKIKIA